MLFKLLFMGIIPILLIIGLIVLIGSLLSIDDLKACTNGPEINNGPCQKADAIVAISGGDTVARTDTAIQLYQHGWASQLILSGAAQDKTSISNAAAMRNVALSAGVPSSVITIDANATDTLANATDLRDMIANQNIHRLILVTSPYHQRRASIEFKRVLGDKVAVLSHPTPNDKYWSPTYWWINPYSWYLAVSELGKLLFLQVMGK